jgi:putative transposase
VAQAKNVVGYLPKTDQKAWRRKLQRAYQETTYEAAKERFTDLHAELHQVSRSAARSLQEGLEETLTLHRLGLFDELGKSLSGRQLHRESDGRCGRLYRQREALAPLATAAPMDGPLMEAEDGFRRLNGYDNLPRLSKALKEEIPNDE